MKRKALKTREVGKVTAIAYEGTPDLSAPEFQRLKAASDSVANLLVPGDVISPELVEAIHELCLAFIEQLQRSEDQAVDALMSIPDIVQSIRIGEARANASARHAKDPKSIAKARALELWLERHSGRQPGLRTVEQFALEVMRRWPVLKSAKVICGWSAAWTKAVKEGRPPAC